MSLNHNLGSSGLKVAEKMGRHMRTGNNQGWKGGQEFGEEVVGGDDEKGYRK